MRANTGAHEAIRQAAAVRARAVPMPREADCTYNGSGDGHWRVHPTAKDADDNQP